MSKDTGSTSNSLFWAGFNSLLTSAGGNVESFEASSVAIFLHCKSFLQVYLIFVSFFKLLFFLFDKEDEEEKEGNP